MKPAKWADLAGLVFLGACVPGGDSNGTGGASTAFTERDSAGIVIAVTLGSQARAALGWEVDTVPDLEIGVTGESSGDESAVPWQQFHRIGGVRQLSDGRVVVVDGGSREVRFFDSRGQFLHRFGGSGQGPGEFGGNPVLVPAFQSDSLLLFDPRPVRFHFLSTDADGYRLVRPATWSGAVPPVGFIDSNLLVQLGNLQKPTTTGVYEIPLTFAWTHIVTGNRTFVDSFTWRPQYMTKFVNNIAFGGLIPFSSTPSAAVTRNGALVTEGALPEIKEYNLEGRLQRIIRIYEPRRNITNTDIQRYVEVTGKPTNPDIPIPEMMPTFESLLVDDEGWLWAKVYEYDPEQRPAWVVFDPSGRAHGSIRTPVGLRVQQIAGDFMLGVWTDELGVEHVRKHRVDRRSGEG
jgi:hypothetical protein